MSDEGNLNDGVTGEGIDNNFSGPKWMAQLPDDLKGNQNLTKYATIGDLGNAVLDLEGKTKNSVQMLSENSTQEEKDHYYKTIGRPDRAEDYAFDVPDDLPEEVMFNDDNVAKFKNAFHGMGLTKEQAKGLFDFSVKHAMEEKEYLDNLASELKTKNTQEMKKLWGGEFDKNVELAARGFEKITEVAGLEGDAKKYFEDSGFGDDPLFLRIFHVVGKVLEEDDVNILTGGKGDDKKGKRDETGRLELSFPSMDK